jgi:cytochrome P450
MSREPVKKRGVMIEGVNILGAGADITTIGILSILDNLLQNTAELEHLQREIDQACIDLGLKEGQGISFKNAEKLPYLAAVITESTRLHPSIQHQLPQYVPKGEIQIG